MSLRILAPPAHTYTVRRSLHENDLTIVTIFVNPAQFAPHEDLDAYPRTLHADLDQLTSQKVTVSGAIRTPSAVFLPGVQDMYPSGIPQDVALQKGTFVDIRGYSHQMEGATRPHFFRGVATIVTKLFNLVQVGPFSAPCRWGVDGMTADECVFWAKGYSAVIVGPQTVP